MLGSWEESELDLPGTEAPGDILFSRVGYQTLSQSLTTARGCLRGAQPLAQLKQLQMYVPGQLGLRETTGEHRNELGLGRWRLTHLLCLGEEGQPLVLVWEGLGLLAGAGRTRF